MKLFSFSYQLFLPILLLVYIAVFTRNV